MVGIGSCSLTVGESGLTVRAARTCMHFITSSVKMQIVLNNV